MHGIQFPEASCFSALHRHAAMNNSTLVRAACKADRNKVQLHMLAAVAGKNGKRKRIHIHNISAISMVFWVYLTKSNLGKQL